MGRSKPLIDTYIIFKINVLSLRSALVPYLVISLLIPLGFTYIISLASTYWSLEAKLNYLIGALTLSLALTTINGAAQTIAQDKHLGRLRLFSTLPISPIAYVVGVTASFFISGLLSTVLIALIGGYLWGLLSAFLDKLPTVIALELVSCVALIGLGAIIGTRSRTLTHAYMYSNLLSMIIAALTPAYYPPTMLPPVLRLVSLALPTTHAACLIRAMLVPKEPLLLSPELHAIALAVTTFIYLVIGFKGIKWIED